ncbi:hypothetical protein M0Q50_07915 [bacterium]|jgi:hypothetical protein|nr:hypothetical protein [bacterium]
MNERLIYYDNKLCEIKNRLKKLIYTNRHEEYDYLMREYKHITELIYHEKHRYDQYHMKSEKELKNELRQKKLDSLL